MPDDIPDWFDRLILDDDQRQALRAAATRLLSRSWSPQTETRGGVNGPVSYVLLTMCSRGNTPYHEVPAIVGNELEFARCASPTRVLLVLDALDKAECEVERLRAVVDAARVLTSTTRGLFDPESQWCFDPTAAGQAWERLAAALNALDGRAGEDDDDA